MATATPEIQRQSDRTNPYEHYRRNQDIYDRIHEHVEATTDAFATASRTRQSDLLNRAVTFALISSQTRISRHERGYLNVVDLDEMRRDTVAHALRAHAVNYHKNKARYIMHNRTEPDTARVLDAYSVGNLDAMHRAIQDEYLGVGLRKAGFAMALTVSTDKMCVDTHVAQMAGIEPDDIYNGVVVDRYETQCERIRQQWPTLADELSPFMCQWVVFDAEMDTVTTHDAWFASLPEWINIHPPGWF
jgi:endonuclease III